MEPTIDQSQNQRVKVVAAAAIVVLILAAGYMVFKNKSAIVPEDTNAPVASADPIVMDQNKSVDGSLPPSSRFPSNIPIETGKIVESATVSYPAQKAEQLSLSYTTTKTVAAKYAEYKNYLTQAGYVISEGAVNSPVRALYGTSAEANLTVFISVSEGETLVQLAYLDKML